MARRKKRTSNPEIPGLPKNQSDLLWKILDYGSPEQRGDDRKEHKDSPIWEGRIFKDFILRRGDLKSKIRKGFVGGEKRVVDVSFRTLERASQGGISAESAMKIFCYAAEVYGNKKTDYLREFIQFCIDTDHFTPRAFREDDDVIQEILGRIIEEDSDRSKKTSEEDLTTDSKSVGHTATERNHVKLVYEEKPIPPYIGDAIEVDRVSNQNIQAQLRTPYSDDFIFKGKFSVTKNKDIFDKWMKGYLPEVENYIQATIEDESNSERTEGAKIGFVAYNSDSAASGAALPLVIRPLNHLVTAAFNRKLATERINYNALSQGHQLWHKCFSKAVNTSIQGFEFQCPSQLFMEFGIVTTDNYVPITLKRTKTSVYLGSQDTYYVGNIKGVGRIYQQTFIDTYCRVAFARLYTEKTAITAADTLNAVVLPFYEEQNVPLLRILTDRGTEYCGKAEHHAYQLYLGIENIDHTRTKANSPQTNGICERFHKTMQDEFYCIAFRKKLYTSLEELQTDVDEWLKSYNETRPHSGKYCYGKTPMQTLIDAKELVQSKNIGTVQELSDSAHQAALAGR